MPLSSQRRSLTDRPRPPSRPPLVQAVAASCSRWAPPAPALRPPQRRPRWRPRPPRPRRRQPRRRAAIASPSTSATTTTRPAFKAGRDGPGDDHAARAQGRRRTHPRSRLHAPCRRTSRHDRPAHVPQALGPRGRRRRVREPAAVRHHGQGAGGRRRAERQARGASHRVHALLGRAARSTPWSRTACGCGRSRCSIRRSTSARTARRARRSASTAMHRELASPEDADEARRRQVAAHELGRRASTRSATAAARQQGVRARRRVLGRQRRSTATSSRTCCASSCRSSARTTATTRRASATRRRSPA